MNLLEKIKCKLLSKEKRRTYEPYIHYICNKYDIRNYTINDDGSVDVNNNVHLYNKVLTEIPINFNNVYGNFDCSVNQLTSLRGCPKYVDAGFGCYRNELTSLEFAPEYIALQFYCHDNKIKEFDYYGDCGDVHCDGNIENIKEFLSGYCTDDCNTHFDYKRFRLAKQREDKINILLSPLPGVDCIQCGTNFIYFSDDKPEQRMDKIKKIFNV